MSKRQFRVQASSSRASSSNPGFGLGGSLSSSFRAGGSPLSFIREPPELGSIFDPNVIVIFKNLLKKDGITKARALEELQSYISTSSEEVEDAIIEAWVEIYPRVSVDSSRRVRQLSHNVHGLISISCGKRIRKHVPKIAGAWLAATFDSDKSVSKSAQDSFRQVFPTSDKLSQFGEAYQRPILEYSRDVLSNETAQTLSDERSVSPEDAESKYAHVVASLLSVLLHMITTLTNEQIAKHQQLHDEVVARGKLWRFSYDKDVAPRKVINQLLRAYLSKRSVNLDNEVADITSAFLTRALKSDQTGSAHELVATLASLSAHYPDIWTSSESSNKSPFQRLLRFLEKGSQTSPSGFWDNVAALFDKLPRHVFSEGLEAAAELLQYTRTGITRRDEPRPNTLAAWNTYFHIAGLLEGILNPEQGEALSRQNVFPVVLQYIQLNPEDQQWTVSNSFALQIVHQAIQTGACSSVLAQEWVSISDYLIAEMRKPQPEQGKDFDKSQVAIRDLASRWASVQVQVLQSCLPEALSQNVLNGCSRVLEEALTVVTSTNGNHYGAASVLDTLLRLCRHSILHRKETSEPLLSFVSQKLPRLFMSSSCKYLASLLYALHGTPIFKAAWISAVDAVVTSPESEMKLSALDALLDDAHLPSDFTMIREAPILQNYIIRAFKSATDGEADWTWPSRVFSSAQKILTPESLSQLMTYMTDALLVPQKARNALYGFEEVIKRNSAPLLEFTQTSNGSKLLPALLFLTESPDDQLANQASEINRSLQTLMSQDADVSPKKSMLNALRDGLNVASELSVSVHTLVELAQTLLSHDAVDGEQILKQVIPEQSQWSMALAPFLKSPPSTAIEMTNSLRGTVFLVDTEGSQQKPIDRTVAARDGEGISLGLRMAQYTVELLSSTKGFDSLETELKSKVLENLLLSMILAHDNLILAHANDFWSSHDSQSEAEIIDFVSKCASIMVEWLQASSYWFDREDTDVGDSFVKSTLDHLWSEARGSSATSYYNARGAAWVSAHLIDIHGVSSKGREELEETIATARGSEDVMCLSARLAGQNLALSHSRAVNKLINELVADLTGINFNENSKSGLRKLVLLNLASENQEEIIASLAKSRLIFLIKRLIASVQEGNSPIPIQTETCKALDVLLPAVQEMYGSHWSETLKYLTNTWLNLQSVNGNAFEKESNISHLHATLRLYARLGQLTKKEDPNDDLCEAWTETEKDASKGLLHLLKLSHSNKDTFNQPLTIYHDLLSRQLPKTSLSQPEENAELYPLLYAESKPVQQSAFIILHTAIPKAQGDYSIEVAIEKKTAQLPDELLSLIVSLPVPEEVGTAATDELPQLSLRGYLLGWILLFDHFQNSSYKVRNDYAESIKEGGYISALMDYMSEALGHTRGKSVDISKWEIAAFDELNEDTPVKELQWLLAHLYYLCLKHIPAIAKSWWMECKSRQTVIALETWTEKYISRHIIADALKAVDEWASSQDTDEETLTVKVNYLAKEVIGGYKVDDQEMMIVIRLPSSYPLHQASVEGVNRVAVDEKKWQSWLRITQGVITFSVRKAFAPGDGPLLRGSKSTDGNEQNNNLSDGLIAWRKNVVGALKGQTECAICYSIISADKQLPSKRCGTCKNLFHSICLFRWFKTSNSSSCPLCRNAFNYG